MKKTLIEWLTYMQGIHVSAIDMGLSRVLPVAEKLGLMSSASNAYVFTVTGTNGKGSTTAVIAEICQQSGYKTGLYQSPHLIHFNERIKIDGIESNDELLIKAFEQVEQARLACELSLSFFEMTTLAAFLIFADSHCDVWVLEVGLGGRLDVVNIIDPDMTVITNIGIDHVDWLGDDREKIGYEKAGILRPHVPLVFGDQDMPKSVQAKIDELAIDCYQHTVDFNFLGEGLSIWQYSNTAISLQLDSPALSLVNTSNAITAVLASSLHITVKHINTAMTHCTLAGRFDLRTINNRQWLFDVAHNKAGVQFLLSQLISKLPQIIKPSSTIHLVFSMLQDKDIATVVKLLSNSPALANFNKHWYIAPIDDRYCPRSASLERLNTIVSQYVDEKCVSSFNDLARATQAVITQSNQNDLILVCGSFHNIAECLNAIDLIE